MSKSKYKRVGIIGGLGPKASSRFYDLIVDHTVADCDQDHLDIAMLSYASLPDRTDAIISGDKAEIVSSLRESIEEFEKLNVELIATPCNTVHYYYDEMTAATDIPVINMVEDAVAEAVKLVQGKSKTEMSLGGVEASQDITTDKGEAQGDIKLGIMATAGTRFAGVYEKACAAAGVESVAPSDERQADISSLIYDDIKAGHKGDFAKFQRAYDEMMEAGCDAVILACTELSVFAGNYELPDNCIDAMDVLVRETIERAGARYK